ncbi:MAG: beta-ketoacyl-[acyl-carrier-protein] synthase II [Candidatus Latescibacteria bacterium 4484_7]|nr:MAG: beta-ketoacyl-[acyl-carrier-protein] synthase II [Candidatus Latescibacteria bacterium 4484_7]
MTRDKRRVVVTAMGTFNPCGNSVQETWDNVSSGRSGIARIEAFDVSDYDSKIGGEVKGFDPLKFMDKKDARHTDRSAQFAVAASIEAMDGVDTSDFDTTKFGVIIGSGIGGIKTFEAQHTVLMERGPSRISPFFIPMMISDMAAGQVSIVHGLRGPNFGTVSACASGGHAISDSFMYIKNGYADAMLTGGAEATISPMALGGFCSMKALSVRNDDPERASRPFDKDRDGFVMSEGSGIILLEELEHAKKRGATILAEITGVGLTGDAYHITSPVPGGMGAANAMKMALDDAGLEPNDIDYINAHGTSTYYNDKAEAEAISSIFGSGPTSPKVSSTKSMTGHLLGAAAAVEFVICVKALNEGLIPPTINLDNPDPECNVNHVANDPVEQDLKNVMSNSFGFGGHNVSIILSKYES